MKMASMNVKSQGDSPSTSDVNDYDRSPSLYLSDAQLTALGITNLPKPGTEFILMARAVVQSVSASDYEGDGKPNASMSLRLPELCLESGKTDHSKVIYGQ